MREPSTSAGWQRWCPAALLAAAFNVGIRLGAMAPAQRPDDARSLWALLGRELLLGCAVLGLCAALSWLGRRLGTRPGRSLWLLLGVVGAALSASLARSLVGGAWIAAQAWSPAVPLGAALLGAWAFPCGYRLLVWRPLPASQAERALQIGGALAAASLGVAVDVRVYAGLYPSAHLAAQFGAAACALAAAGRLLGLWPGLRGPRVARASLLGLSLGLWGFVDMDARTRASVFGGAEAGSMLARAGAWRERPSLRRELSALLAEPWSAAQGAPLASPAPRRDPRYNVLLLAVDTLRADALPPARPAAEPSATPFLDQLVARSVRFARAYAPATITTKSMPALFYGQDASRALDERDVHLATLLAGAGYQSFAVVPAWFQVEDYLQREKRLMLAAFAHQHAYPVSDGAAAAAALERSLSEVSEPFFGWLHTLDLHDPRWAGPGRQARGDLRASYRAALGYVDTELRALMALLERRELLGRTIVVLLADHGELLGEHGADFHGTTVYEAEARVPFALTVPGCAPRVLAGPVSTLDLAPTLLALLGVPALPAHQGRSLSGLVCGGADLPEPRSLYVENASGRVAAVIAGDLKLTYNTLTGASTLHDLARDPGERENLYDPRAPGARALFRALATHQPRFWGRELGDPESDALLARFLARPDARAGAELSFALSAASLVSGPEARRAAAALYDRSEDVRVREEIVARLGEPALGRPWPHAQGAPPAPRYFEPGASGTFPPQN